MSKVTLGFKNASKPAPKWYRKFRAVFYFLFVGALFNSTLQRFGITSEDVTFITGWSVSVVEALGMILANGEEYRAEKNED